MTIVLKNSTVAAKVPLPADLVAGELALNSADGLAFMKLNDGTVKTLGGSTGGWVRNPQWMPMPATTSAQEQVDLLVAVYPESNYIAFTFNTSAGTYTVDWGDGTAPVTVASGTAAQYLYDFNAAGLTTTSLSYKQAMIKVTPTTGGATFSTVNLQTKNSTANLSAYAQPILDATISANCTTLIISGITVPLRLIERCNILRHSSTNATSWFQSCSSLQSVPLFNTANVTNMTGMFQSCSSLQSVPLFNTANVISMSTMFTGCSSLQSVPLFNTANVTNMGNSTTTGIFANCSSLRIVPLLNTLKVTSFSNIFFNCVSLPTVPAFDTSSATGTTAFTSMFQNCASLQEIQNMNFNVPAITTNASYTAMFTACASLSKIGTGAPNTGPKFTFSVASCKLSAAALNALYTSLPTVTGQTITVTGNVGIAGDDPTIATNKGWTVTGS